MQSIPESPAKNFKNALESYIKLLDRRLNAGTSIFNLDYQDKTIHQLRLNLKKRKAIYQLIEIVEPAFNSKEHYLEYKPLFNKLGKLRDPQVQLKSVYLMETQLNEKFNLYANQLKSKEIRGLINLKKLLINMDTQPILEGRKMLITLVDQIDEMNIHERISEYINTQGAIIEKMIIVAEKNKTELHKIRIRLKSFYYNIQFINEHLFTKKLKAEVLQDLDILQDSLGKLHDMQISLFFIDAFKKEKYSKKVTSGLNDMEAQLSLQLKELLTNINTRLKKFPDHMLYLQKRILKNNKHFQENIIS